MSPNWLPHHGEGAHETFDLGQGVSIHATLGRDVWLITWDDREIGTAREAPSLARAKASRKWSSASPDGERFYAGSLADVATALYLHASKN